MTTRPVVLLGPQRWLHSVAAAVSELEVDGPIAVITAGWQEREDETAELDEVLEGRTVNLRLYARAETVWERDPELKEAHRKRQWTLRTRRDFYRIRLEHALEAARIINNRTAPSEILEDAQRASIQAIRDLDETHLAVCRQVHREFAERWRPIERPAVAEQIEQINEILASCAAVAIAGGHVATLLNRLRLFDLAEPLRRLPLLAWSAGAMAVTERVVLFHDSPPHGPGIAEVMEPGLGICPDLVALPHPRHRLDLHDTERLSTLVRRFDPARCLAFTDGARVTWSDGRLQNPRQILSLCENGSLTDLDGRAVAPAGAPDDEADARSPASPEAPSDAADQPAIERLERSDPDPAAIEAFLAGHRFPIVEGELATFCWRGEADAVKLRHFVYGLETAQDLDRLPGTDLWYLRFSLPKRSRVEYKLEVHRNGHGEWIVDPLNPHMSRDPFGGNSVVAGADYRVPEWTRPRDKTRRGSVEPLVFESEILKGRRTGHIYLPARFRKGRRYPLLVVHDGSDFLNFADFKTVLDNLIHRLEIPPLIAVLLDSPDRLVEYADHEGHARFLVEELLPDLEARLPIMRRPQGRCLMGASFGAVAAFSTAVRYPNVWGRLLLQSGSFAFTDIGDRYHRGPRFERVVDFVNRYRNNPAAVADQVFVTCGLYESLIYENRSLVPLLRSTGMEVRFVESQDGHNWENWRDRLREALSWLLPGPLMMVYE